MSHFEQCRHFFIYFSDKDLKNAANVIIKKLILFISLFKFCVII